MILVVPRGVEDIPKIKSPKKVRTGKLTTKRFDNFISYSGANPIKHFTTKGSVK